MRLAFTLACFVLGAMLGMELVMEQYHRVTTPELLGGLLPYALLGAMLGFIVDACLHPLNKEKNHETK